MYSSVYSAGIVGLEARIIQVEADVSGGLPVFHMVGVLASAVKEARERVRISLQNSGFHFPAKHITVNLSPADLRKDGSGFDLPIAISLLAAFGMIPQNQLNRVLIAGELGLDGNVEEIHGALSMALMGKKEGYHTFLLPCRNAEEAGMVEGIRSIGVATLSQAVSFLRGESTGKPVRVNYADILKRNRNKIDVDFGDIIGQPEAKKALEIAVSGGHNALLIGAPGTGKTMLARAVPGIMPPLSVEEALEITKIYSVAGMLPKENPVITTRPFRAPHHTIPPTALAGGGKCPVPGEITLAHFGVLFLDELPEFSRNSLEILRQPMEERRIRISRLGKAYDYPADSIVIGAMNPCRCGHFPDMRKCRCTAGQIQTYLSRLSEPLLDRMDLCVEMETPGRFMDGGSAESSESIRGRVVETRERQKFRYRNEQISRNGQLEGAQLKKYCSLKRAERLFVDELIAEEKISMRGVNRLLRAARTIADSEGCSEIGEPHLLRAYSFKSMNQKFWGTEVRYEG